MLLNRIVPLILLLTAFSAQPPAVGNVIFLHPDGTGLSHWNAARMYWQGPDGLLAWDQLPEMAVYRGHMTDRLTGSSHGGATVHAFGYKVPGSGSFGQYGSEREMLALSGYPGSIMREAAAAGHPVGIVNDGDLPEPGTGVFLAEVDSRNESNKIARQFLDGRPGFEGEPAPAAILGGGERFFLPADTPMCAGEITPGCAVHTDAITGQGPARQDGRNLIREAVDRGYEVIRTRAEFEALMTRLAADAAYTPRVLGLFAADDIFNAQPEERLLELGLVDPGIAPDSKTGNLIMWGGLPGTPGYNPPTAAEMGAMALMILERHSVNTDKPFFLVAEVESSDNLPNNANAMGMLQAAQRADALIGVARAFVAENPNTLILTAADSDAGAPQVFSPPPLDENGNVTASHGNPTGSPGDSGFPLDGRYGRGAAPFIAEPDAFGNRHAFAIGWPGSNDVAGGIISRAEGLNADMLTNEFYPRFDNTDVYRIMYATLFGEMLPPAYGITAPGRE